MQDLYNKYKSIILYIIFGGLTTLINIVVYNGCYYQLHMSNTVANVIAWVLSVIFAFVTNKIWVFESKTTSFQETTKEAVSFTTGRLATGLMDLGIMYVAVDVLAMNAFIWKIISNVLVIILNYVISKLFVFKNKGGEPDDN